MAPYATITLDTTAPDIAWGQSTGALSGQTLRVPYVVTEPGVVSAELRTPHGRVVPMTVGPTELTAELPSDVGSSATLVAVLRDDVSNEKTAELFIDIIAGRQPPTLILGGTPGGVVF